MGIKKMLRCNSLYLLNEFLGATIRCFAALSKTKPKVVFVERLGKTNTESELTLSPLKLTHCQVVTLAYCRIAEPPFRHN
jgi:hypothetical protein